MRSRTGFLWLFTWAVIAFAAVYVAKPHVPVYVVPDGLWEWRVPPGTPAIAWYGRLAVSMVAALIGALFALTLHNSSARIRTFFDTRAGVRWLSTIILATLTLAGAWLSIHEWQHWISH